MAIVEYQRNGILISTNKSKLDVGMIYDYLANSSYWAKDRPMEIVEKTIQNSLCFGIYSGSKQIGFARVVTDFAVFAWLCDVFILDSYRSQGLGKWLVECVVRHPDLQNLSRMMLATWDAQTLYQKYGDFRPLVRPEWIMERVQE
jgi:GNAT superfamily N-acetyltransferase